MGQVIFLPVVPRVRAFYEAPVDIRLADRTNVADFPIIFSATDARMTRRRCRSLLADDGAA